MTLDDDLTEEELDELVEQGSDEERRAVAKHPNTSLTTLLKLAEWGFAEDVDQNPLLPLYVEAGSYEVGIILEKLASQTERGERLEELASSVWYKVRCAVAVNKNMFPVTLTLLAKDKEGDVRAVVAENVNTPPETLILLAKDEDKYVRRRVADNESTPPTTLSLLAEDEDGSVRYYVANNKHTPVDTLISLAKDETFYRYAKKTLAKIKKDSP